MSGHRHTTTLTAAEQAIARHGSVQAAAAKTDIPLRDLADALRQMSGAPPRKRPKEKPRRNENRRTPVRHICISNDIWQQLTDLADTERVSRAEIITAGIRRELAAREEAP